MDIKKTADLILISDKPKREKIKALCRLIREIPYKRIGSLNPKIMVKRGKGSCTPKHIFLASYFKKIGIQVKFLIIPFFYKKLPIKYPADKLEIVDNMPIAYHVALKAKINGRWTIIDVTWDSELKNLNFPVNDNWDGESDMALGVIPEEIIEVDKDPEKFEKVSLKEYTKEEIKDREEFYKMFSEFLESVR